MVWGQLYGKNFVIHVQYILELCFKTFQGISNIFQIYAEPLCSNFENMQKCRIKQTPVLFCKYLPNESLDLHEILLGGQLLSCRLLFQISLRFVHKCTRTSCKRVRARFIEIAWGYNSCARIYAQILMKFETYAHKIVIYQQIKFHEDLSFCCRDIRKTILVFFNH